MNLLLLCLNSSILLCSGPQKCDRSVWFARRFKGIFKIHYTTGHFIPRKYLNLVFYDNRNLEISKSKKSERYFRDKIEIFIRLFDEHFARHFESHWRETWRHTGKRTVHRFPWRHLPPAFARSLVSSRNSWPCCCNRFIKIAAANSIIASLYDHILWAQKKNKS